MNFADLFGGGQAYVHNGDRDLMQSLGLKTNFGRDWTDVGTVELANTTVKVEVSALPAQFFRFTIRFPDGRTTVVTTGSGSFWDYWDLIQPFALTAQWPEEVQSLVADDMFEIEES